MNNNDKYAQYGKAVRYTANGPVRMSTPTIKAHDHTMIYLAMFAAGLVAVMAFVVAISL